MQSDVDASWHSNKGAIDAILGDPSPRAHDPPFQSFEKNLKT